MGQIFNLDIELGSQHNGYFENLSAVGRGVEIIVFSP